MAVKVALYSTVGSELTRYEVDVEGAALARRESVPLLANAQYAWTHPSRRYLYIATSNRGRLARDSKQAHVSHGWRQPRARSGLQARHLDVETAGKDHYWMGMVGLA